MNMPVTTFRLIILNDSQEEAQRLISMFQNADKPCRAKCVNDEPCLNKLLEEQSWDLLIGHRDTKSLTPMNAIKLIQKLNRDLPVIILADEVDPKFVIESMKQGAKDVVQLDDDQHLLLVVARELENRQQRQITRRAERRVKEIERRNQRLLDRSRDAIAFIQDGMYLYANDSFAELFGYKDKDDIECMPIMDMIDSKDQSDVKQRLKAFTLHHDSEEHCKLQFRAITQSGDKKLLDVNLQMAHYDEEPCIQFIVPAKVVDDEKLEAELESVKYTDQATGLFNRQYMLERLESAIDAVANNDETSILLYIDIDNYSQTVESVVGIESSDQVLAKIADFVQKNTMSDQISARFADNVFVCLFSGNQTNDALQQANKLCKEVADHLFEIDKKTLQLTLSIGIVVINETSSNVSMVVDQAIKAVAHVRNQNDTKVTGNGAYIYQEEKSSDAKNIITNIQTALEKGQFRLLFQPIVSLRGDDKEHYEVVVNLFNENGQELSLDALLKTDVGKKSTDKIDRWVILETFKRLAEHHKKNNKTRAFITINIQSIFDESLVSWLKVVFKASKLPYSDVTFQIKEADITQHLTTVKKFVDTLHDMGTSFCISHFGCGLNPMSLLEHIDTDYIKIDSSFPQEIQDNPGNSETLGALMSQLNERQKATIIPMVENASILSKLWQMGVHYIQGSYLQGPTENMDYDFSNEG
jgi:multidomain signaling protein FimX